MIAIADHEYVIDLIGSYRKTAIISIDDIRVAATSEGRPLDHISGRQMARVLKTRCDYLPERSWSGSVWRRRW